VYLDNGQRRNEDMSELYDMIMRHEGTGPKSGTRYLPYTDTVGKLTIGYGRNLTDRGISEHEAKSFLAMDIQDTITHLHLNYRWFDRLDGVRRDAIVDMAFNLGAKKFSGFVKFIQALDRSNWPEAQQEMLNSLWATQVGDRATELSEMVLTGRYR